MNYTADTSFFMKLSEGSEKAVTIWKDIRYGKSRLAIPTAVIVELKKGYMKRNLQREADEIINELEISPRVTLVPLTTDRAKRAADMGYAYNLTSMDAIVAATAVDTSFTALLTSDAVFLRLNKDKKLDVVNV